MKTSSSPRTITFGSGHEYLYRWEERGEVWETRGEVWETRGEAWEKRSCSYMACDRQNRRRTDLMSASDWPRPLRCSFTRSSSPTIIL